MEQPRKIMVSCLTPTLNSEKYLEIFLSEIELQDLYPNFEVILNMSSPNDVELEIANRYKAKYGDVLQLIVHKNILPLGVAWNECIEVSKADVLAIWNVDDLRTPNSLSSQVKVLTDTDAVVSYGPYKVVNQFRATTGRDVLELGLTPEDFRRGMHFGPFMAFTKSGLSMSGLFDEQLRSGGDFDLAIRLSLQGVAIRTPEYLGYYLDVGLGASTSPESKQLVERTLIELRYAIYEKIDWLYVDHALNYDVKYLHIRGERIPVDGIRGVESLIAQNQKGLAVPGRTFLRRSISAIRHSLGSFL
jgi:glycosyltransferase involved in cell wall biosynthesis